MGGGMNPKESVLAGGHFWPQWKREEDQAADVKLVCKQCGLVQTIAEPS